MKQAFVILLFALVAFWVIGSWQPRVQLAAQGTPHDVYTGAQLESFVPHNSRRVGKKVATIVEMDTLYIKSTFDQLVREDAGKFDIQSLPPLRHTPHTREEAMKWIQLALDRVNAMGDRAFHVLDVQSIDKETTFDPQDRAVIDRYDVNLFVQEKNPLQVHAAAHNFHIEMLVKPATGEQQIRQINFITDHYYTEPLVGGDNPYDRHYRIENPFHLMAPFKTSGDQVLPSDDKQISLLREHHRGMRTPKYRCFESPGDASNAEECTASGGYWDKPVKSDDECPFYQANKNYVNRLGGVHPDGQFCEMPVGTKRIGYRFISPDPEHKPWCYNCRIGADGNPGSAGPCCDEQRNKQLYPNLNGPDFMFPSDILFRGQHRRELAERGLNWRRHPTRTRDVTNPRQKQPVFNAIIGSGPGKLDPESFPN